MRGRLSSPVFRAAFLAGVLLLVVGGTLTLRAASRRVTVTTAQQPIPPPPIDDSTLPERREPSPSPSPSPEPPRPERRRPGERNIDVYRGLGAWVDIYDDVLDPIAAIDEMVHRGVKTLYLETNNYHSRGEPNTCTYGPDVDIRYPETVEKYLDRAHARGINVVAWYVPGLADMDRDIKRTLAAIKFVTKAGNRFDGYAADIEVRGEFGCKGLSGDDQRIAFNSGIVEYNRRLRAAGGTEQVLGAIVVDAKNNERVPTRWAGFPWGDIAGRYDVIMPMAYWSVNPANGGCPGADLDTAGYIGQVASKTTTLMGLAKPMHHIGGIADCITTSETAGYVTGASAVGSLGVSLYDFSTMEEHSERDALWAELSKFSG